MANQKARVTVTGTKKEQKTYQRKYQIKDQKGWRYQHFVITVYSRYI